MTNSKRSIIESATRPVRVVPASEQLPTRTPNQYQAALTQDNRADGWRRELDVSLIRAGRAAMIDGEKDKPRKARKSRNRKEPAFDQHAYKTAAKEWLYAVSSQVMVWLVMNTTTEKPARRSGQRELTSFRHRLNEPW